MSSAIVPISPVAIQPAGWESKLDLVRRNYAKDASPDEFEIFLHQCRKTGLDPMAKQIYFQKRGGKMTIITGIDGYRLVADRTGKYAGNDDPEYDDAEKQPTWAKVTVYKMVEGQRCPFTATARWSQYYPGDGLGFMWKKMPHLMLGKCAEALALRKAFPAELSGVYTVEEMQQAEQGSHPWETKNHEVNESTPATCEKCSKDIVDIDNPQGGKFKKLTALQAIAFSEKNHGASWCWDCISAEKRKQVDENGQNEASKEATANKTQDLTMSTTPPEDATPDPFFTKDLSGKLVLQGTVTELKDGNPFVISFGKERISTFSKSMKEMLKEAKGKKVIAEYTEVEKGDKTFKNLVDVRRVGDQEYDGGLPVIDANADMYITDGDTK